MAVKPDLKSKNPLDIAMALTDLQIGAIKNPNIAERLKNLREIVWSEETKDMNAKTAAFDAVLKDLNQDDIKLLCESYARMGELYEVASLTARDNEFAAIEKSGDDIPGGVAELIKNDPLEAALKKLGMPVFEVTMTMHPTNVKSLASMKAARQVALAMRPENKKDLAEAIKTYQGIPILHESPEGKPANLTVRDETNTVLNYLGNIYDDLPAIFKQYDEPFTAKFGPVNHSDKTAEQKAKKYDPLDLQLQARFASWGSAGDKDGNNNVTGEKTLEAIVLHTQDIVRRYSEDLKSLASSDGHLNKWKEDLATAYTSLEAFMKRTLKCARSTIR